MACEEQDLGHAPFGEEWPEKPKVRAEVNPREKLSVTEVGMLLRWLKEMNVTEYHLLDDDYSYKHEINSKTMSA